MNFGKDSMKLNGLRQIRRIFCLIALIAVAGYFLLKIKYNCEVPVYQVYSCLKLFIQENKRMPLSQQELVEGGYLRIEEKDKERYYLIRCDLVEVVTRLPAENNKYASRSWTKIPFTRFFIRYGIQKDDYVLRNHILCDTITDEKILLFTGPWSCFLSGTYQKLSADLYMELVKSNKSEQEK